MRSIINEVFTAWILFLGLALALIGCGFMQTDGLWDIFDIGFFMVLWLAVVVALLFRAPADKR